MNVIGLNVVNFAIIGLIMILWRFGATFIAAKWPNSIFANAFGLVAG